MKNILFIFFLVCSISIYAESKFTFRGEIIDYDTKGSVIGAAINFYSEGIFVERMFSDKNGYFEFTTTKPIDVIEVKFIGKITIKIIEVDVYNEKINDFSFKVPLFETPFLLIGYEKKPTSSERRREKEKRKGVHLDCKNDNKALIKYSKKGDYQFVKFIDLINCEK